MVIDASDTSRKSLMDRLSRGIQSHADVAVFEIDRETLGSNPIEKGKIVSSLQTRSLIVAVGDSATEFVTNELENTPIYFVGAGVVSGAQLESQLVTGVFSYNVDSLLDAVKSLWPGKLGLVYTPGYETVVGWIRKGSSERGLGLTEKKVSNLREFAPAARDLLERTQSIWVLGDPQLVHGAGFDFLRERALSRKTPIIGNEVTAVRDGAFMAFEPKSDSLASQATDVIDSILLGQLERKDSLRSAQGNGTIVVNGALVGKWSIVQPTGITWRIFH